MTKDSIPPAGGVYQKDENGELTGSSRKRRPPRSSPPCSNSARRKRTPASGSSWPTSTPRHHQRVRRVASGRTRRRLRARRRVPRAARARRPHRAHQHVPHRAGGSDSRRKLRDEFADNDLLRSPGLKQFFDGVSSTHTAWLSEPYSNAAHEGECGAPVTDPERMRTIVLGAAEEGFAVRIHTIGDKAIHTALDIFEEAREKFGAPNGQNGLEHLENFLPGDIERLAELDVCANCQPPHTVLDPNGIERDLGPERAKLMWPYKSYLDAGVKFSFGTDSPVVDINSREVIYDAVTRQSPATGEPAGGWQPHEKIPAADAVRAYTLGSAIAAGRDDEVGSLTAGKLADLAVLDTDLVTCAPEDILGAKVLATYLDGKKVYEA
ncbi:MAG: amidohydrolase [Eggerthella lenta]